MNRRSLALLTAAAAALAAAPAASAQLPFSSDPSRAVGINETIEVGPFANVRISAGTSAAAGGACDPLDPSVCMYPWPSNHLTKADPSTDTGRRLNLGALSMPRNIAGRPIEASDYNRLDGFSPGNLIATRVPGLDTQAAFAASSLIPIDDIGAHAALNAPAVVIDTATGQRHPIWAELDVNPASNADRALILRPAVNFEEGHRYVVALRNLKRADGSPIDAQPVFQAYRDGVRTRQSAIEARRPQMESIFATLAGAGIPRASLYLAWDFTVASERGLSERALSIRDDAFAQLGDTNLADRAVQGVAPQIIVNPDVEDGSLDSVPGDPVGIVDFRELDGVRNYTVAEDSQIARRVVGQIVVPCYLDRPGCPPGSRFAHGANGLPVRIPGNTMLANFMCMIPRKALDGATPQVTLPSLYGHGLLGGAGEVGAGNVKRMAQEHGYTFCATDWAGMSTYDVPHVATILADASNFPGLADRGQQGFVNFMYLGRAMIHPDGFAAMPAFQTAGGDSVIDTSELFYDGNSQGGIMGGSLAALSPDFERAVLGVPAMNYSTLLRRSVDFDTYAVAMYTAYPNELERPLILSLIQLLWDRAEANGYAHHMTDDPLPNTPAHKILMHPAYGDHQVTNYAADVEARTAGIAIHRPALDPFRPQWMGWNLPAISYPSSGSGMVYFDSGPPNWTPGRGVADNPLGEVPNRPFTGNRDPHGDPRNSVHGRVQKAAFLKSGGQIVNVCGATACYADGWGGAP